MNQTEEIRKRLLDNSELLAQVFKRKESEVIDVIRNLSGDEASAREQFFALLNVPLTKETFSFFNSLTKVEKEQSKKSFFDKLKDFFNEY